MEPRPQVEFVGVHKSFGAVRVIDDLTLSVRAGEFLSLLGPSGCGKTTSLGILAGFVTPDRGEVRLSGEVVTHVPTHRRNLGMVFQRYTLFPHMNVFDNVAFGLRLRRRSSAEVARRVDAALALVHLEGVRRRFPGELSGGQQQRIALARALVVEPKVLLLDEPLSSLDAKLRREMQVELRKIHDDLGTTTIYVTHDQEEALVLSDRIAVMQHGRIVQVDTPRAVYGTPRTRFVAEFVGDSNFLPARILARGGSRLRLRAAAGFELDLPPDGAAWSPDVDAAVELVVREDGLRLSLDPPDTTPSVRGTVERVVYHGTFWKYFVRLGAAEVRARAPVSAATPYPPGQEVYVALLAEALTIVEPPDAAART